jgi:hypothetical protein
MSGSREHAGYVLEAPGHELGALLRFVESDRPTGQLTHPHWAERKLASPIT